MNDTSLLLRPQHEARDASPWLVGAIGLAVILIVMVVVAASAGLYHARYADVPTAPRDNREFSFRHGPWDQSAIARDWTEQDQHVRAHLTTYGWNDRRAGVVRLPIERAMQLLTAEAKP